MRVRFIMWLNGLLTEALCARALKGSSAKREREGRRQKELKRARVRESLCVCKAWLQLFTALM